MFGPTIHPIACLQECIGEGCHAVHLSSIECRQVEKRSDSDAPVHIHGCKDDMVSQGDIILHFNEEDDDLFREK